jgi:ribosome-binding ATPase YchF (GTP1/OBG family)
MSALRSKKGNRLKVSVIGLSNSGKTTIFNASRPEYYDHIYSTTSGEPNRGMVRVPDIRIDNISEYSGPEKTTYAAIEYIDYIGMTKGIWAEQKSFRFSKRRGCNRAGREVFSR